MHIFSDESGGTKRFDTYFIVPAVLIEPRVAKQVMKEFRRKTRLKGEIKGSLLSPNQRQKFFDIFDQRGENVTGATICDRSTPIGRWAMANLEEYVLRSKMVVQSCTLLRLVERVQRHGALRNPIRMIQDGGRYKKARLARARAQITQKWERRFPGMSFTHQYGDSEDFDGLQIVDIIGNTFYRWRSGSPDAELAKSLIEAQVASGSMRIEPLELSS